MMRVADFERPMQRIFMNNQFPIHCESPVR